MLQHNKSYAFILNVKNQTLLSSTKINVINKNTDKDKILIIIKSIIYCNTQKLRILNKLNKEN